MFYNYSVKYSIILKLQRRDLASSRAFIKASIWTVIPGRAS